LEGPIVFEPSKFHFSVNAQCFKPFFSILLNFFNAYFLAFRLFRADHVPHRANLRMDWYGRGQAIINPRVMLRLQRTPVVEKCRDNRHPVPLDPNTVARSEMNLPTRPSTNASPSEFLFPRTSRTGLIVARKTASPSFTRWRTHRPAFGARGRINCGHSQYELMKGPLLTPPRIRGRIPIILARRSRQYSTSTQTYGLRQHSVGFVIL
jgi:hypothetical protein